MGQKERRSVVPTQDFRRALAELVSAVIARDGARRSPRGPVGRIRRAAERLGIARSWLSRWLRPASSTKARMSVVSWGALHAGIGRVFGERSRAAREWRQRMASAAWHPGEQAMFGMRDLWRRARFESLFVDGAGRLHESFSYTEHHGPGKSAEVIRRREARHLLSAVQERCGRVLNAFARWLALRDVAPERRAIALLRIVEPLLACADSAYTERHWSTMSAKELRDFIDAGIKREKIVLTREHDFVRIRHAANGDGPADRSWYERGELEGTENMPPGVLERERSLTALAYARALNA